MPRSQNRKRLPDDYALAYLTNAFTEAVKTKKLRPLLLGLFTRGQRTELTQRLRIAFFLHAGWSFRAIAAETGAGTKTVAAVDGFLRVRNPHYRRQVLMRHRHRPQERLPKGFGRNPYIPLSGKWFFRELTGTG